MAVYQCIECKKMMEGFPATLRRNCLGCTNIELEMRYRNKFETFTKKTTGRLPNSLLKN